MAIPGISPDSALGAASGNIAGITSTASGVLDIIVAATIAICAFAIILSVIIDFLEYHKEGGAKEKRSAVATGTMALFFLALYLALRLRIGTAPIDDLRIRVPLTIVALLVVIAGTFVNIKGRYDLGKNWANHIKIYKRHELVTSGMYSLMRHPLYASLIWIAFAASVAYMNWLGIVLTAAVFVPMMGHRAKQEEELLTERFKEYGDYKRSTPRFIPSIFTRKVKRP